MVRSPAQAVHAPAVHARRVWGWLRDLPDARDYL